MATKTSTISALRSLAERLGVLDTSAITFTQARATQAAASLAYYAFFSIFPLMLVFVLVGSYFLDRQNMLQRVTQGVQEVLPISQQFILENLQQVLKQRAAVGIFVLVSLVWSASGVFNNLAYEINQAWPEARRRNFLQSRLIGLNMILGLSALLILSVIMDAATKWLATAGGPTVPVIDLNIWAVLSGIGSWIAVFLLYVAMYRWLPTARVPWTASAWGALAAAVGWKAASSGFAWYLSSPFARFQFVYGSLGAIVAFLFLIYIISLVTLYGAHLTAAVHHLYQKRLARDTEGQPPLPPDDAVEMSGSHNAVAVPGPAQKRAIPLTGMPQDQDGSQPDGQRARKPQEQRVEHEQDPASDSSAGADRPADRSGSGNPDEPVEASPDDAPA